MRGARFAAQLYVSISKDAFQAMTRQRDRVKILSQERITEELQKIVCAKTPATGFRILFETGLLNLILPELADLQGVEAIDGRRQKDTFYHKLQDLQDPKKVV